MDKKIAYISGPISGLQNGNFDKFDLAQKELEKQGYIVVNPHEINKELYQKWASKLDDISQSTQDEIWRDFMKSDIRHLTLCSCVFVLDGWEDSRGSRIEIFLAQKLGMKVYYCKDFSEFTIDFQISAGKRDVAL